MPVWEDGTSDAGERNSKKVKRAKLRKWCSWMVHWMTLVSSLFGDQLPFWSKMIIFKGLYMSMTDQDFQINKATQDLLSTAIALCSTFSTGSGTQMY